MAQKTWANLSHLFTLSDEFLGTASQGRGWGWRHFHCPVDCCFLEERSWPLSASLPDAAAREMRLDCQVWVQELNALLLLPVGGCMLPVMARWRLPRKALAPQVLPAREGAGRFSSGGAGGGPPSAHGSTVGEERGCICCLHPQYLHMYSR